jgi:hypothetical protein
MAAQLKLTQLFETKSLLINCEGYNLNGQIMNLLFKNFKTTRGLHGY